MKWSRFKAFTARNLQLGQVLNWHIFLPAQPDNDQAQREWVEEYVRYIAVRPWKSLDLEAGNTREQGYSCEYWVWFRIENQNVHWRLRPVSDDYERTITEVFAHLKDWHGEYWATQPDRPLVVKAVTRLQKTWKRAERPGGSPPALRSLDIYLAPEGYTL